MKRRLDRKDNHIHISVKRFWFYKLKCIVDIDWSDEFWFLNWFHEREALNKAFDYIWENDTKAVIVTKNWNKTLKECLEILNSD